MIRWSYLVPRLVLVALLLAALMLGFDPLLRWSLIHGGQTLIGAKVEIRGLQTGLAAGKLCLDQVQVADPQQPMKNLVQADEIVLELEPRPLARQRIVVREASARGLQFGTDRQTSGAGDFGLRLDVPLDAVADLGADAARAAADQAQRGLEQLTLLTQQELLRQVEQLESVRVAREVLQRWPAEFTRMEGQADDLQARAQRLRQTVAQRPQDPRAGLEQYQQTLSQIAQLQQELSQFTTELEHLPQQAQADKNRVIEAQQRDLERIRQAFQWVGLGPDGLSQYLLGPEVHERFAEAVRWIRWLGQHAPQAAAEWDALRGRGQDIVFRRNTPEPEWLIRRLSLEGLVRLGTQPFHFAGLATGLTPQPELLSEPTVLQIDFSRVGQVANLPAAGQTPAAGPVATLPAAGATASPPEAGGRLQIVGDYRSTPPRRQIFLECQGWPQSQRTLGRDDQLALAVSPGSTHVWLCIDLAGDTLSGQLQLHQEPLALTPKLADKYGGPALAAALETAARAIRSLTAIVEVSGTLDKPSWSLRSDLGAQLAGAIDLVVRRELESRAAQVWGGAQQQINGDLAAFDETFRTRREAVSVKLRSGTAEIQQVAQALGPGIPGAGKLPGLPIPPGALPKSNGALPAAAGAILNGRAPAVAPLRF